MLKKTRYRRFKRNNGIFFIQDNVSDEEESLQTRDKSEAIRLLAARTEARQQPAINLQIARAFLTCRELTVVKF